MQRGHTTQHTNNRFIFYKHYMLLEKCERTSAIARRMFQITYIIPTTDLSSSFFSHLLFLFLIFFKNSTVVVSYCVLHIAYKNRYTLNIEHWSIDKCWMLMYPCLIQLRLNVQCSTIPKMNINQMKVWGCLWYVYCRILNNYYV